MMDKTDFNLMQRVMKHRKNWQITESTIKFNFKWKYNTQGLLYHKLLMSNYYSEDQYQVTINII